jgi:hypothetical protein
MMGGKFSKKSCSNAPPPPPPPPPPPQAQAQPLQINVDLSSYEAACMHDPDLQSFDATLRENTSRVISSLATGVEVRSLSFDSLREVTNSLLDMNQDVVKVILECKKDVWKNPELLSLVEEYFDNSLKTLDFCTALENCLKRTRDNQLMIIQLAVSHFEEEVTEGVDGVKYVKTLQELRRFKAARDPFTEEFFAMFDSVYKQHVSMFKKLQLSQGKLDKKLKNVKTWRRVSNVIFVTAFLSVLIFSVVAAAIAAPPVVTALAAALAVPMGPVGKWCNSLWKRYENVLKGQSELISPMCVGTYITMKDMDSIRVLVNKLEIGIDSMLQTADFALREEEVMKLAMDEIKKKLDVFMDTIQNLSQHGHKCSQDITMARTVVLRTITKHPNN